MPSSRRRILAGSTVLPLVLAPGCEGLGLGGGASESDDATTTPRSVPPDQSLEGRLLGPDRERPLFDAADVAGIGPLRERAGRYRVPLRLTEEGTARAARTFRTAGVLESPRRFDVAVAVEGETLQRFGIAPDLARAIGSGEWNGELALAAATRSAARDVRAAMAAEIGLGPPPGG